MRQRKRLTLGQLQFQKVQRNESTQVLTFGVTNNNNALFSTQPAIDATGNLTYTPAANANGLATVTVILKDDGRSSKWWS